METLRLSTIEILGQTVNYSDKATYINVGMGFLKDYKLTLDQINKRVRLE